MNKLVRGKVSINKASYPLARKKKAANQARKARQTNYDYEVNLIPTKDEQILVNWLNSFMSCE